MQNTQFKNVRYKFFVENFFPAEIFSFILFDHAQQVLGIFVLDFSIRNGIACTFILSKVFFVNQAFIFKNILTFQTNLNSSLQLPECF